MTRMMLPASERWGGVSRMAAGAGAWTGVMLGAGLDKLAALASLVPQVAQ
jgi:hypothetical protein